MKRVLALLTALALAFVSVGTVPPATAAPFVGESDTGIPLVQIPARPGELGNLRIPYFMNDNGWVVLGTYFTDEWQVWTGSGYPDPDLVTCPVESCSQLRITGLNDSNVIVGQYRPEWPENTPQPRWRGFVWTEATGSVKLEVPTEWETDFDDVEVIGIDDGGNIGGSFRGVCGDPFDDRNPPKMTCAFMAVPADDGYVFEIPYLHTAGGIVPHAIGGGYLMVSVAERSDGTFTTRRTKWSKVSGFEGSLAADQLTGPFRVGESSLVAGVRDLQAAYWSGTDLPITIPLVADIAGDRSRVSDIDDSDRLVGDSNLDNDPRAFLFDPATGELVNLGTVDGKNSFARAITDTGLIAGHIEDSRVAGNMAVIWDPAGTFSVNYPFEVDVSNLSASVTEGETLEYQPTITDPEGDPWTVDWEGLPSGAVWDNSTQTLTWQTQAGDAGTYTPIMIVSQEDDPPLSFTVTLDVLAGDGFELVPIGDRTAVVGEELNFTATVVGGTDPSFDLGWASEPGPDGASLDDSGLFTWTPTLAQVGVYEPTISVFDDGKFDSEAFTITVVADQDPVSIVVNEVVEVLDVAEVTGSVFLHVLEQVRVSDDAGVKPPVSIFVFEQVAVSDDAAVVPPLFITVSETVSVSDRVVVAGPVTITVIESIGVADDVAVTPAELGSVSGVKWEDLDGDGVRDEGEPLVQGVVVYLDIDDNGALGEGEPWTVTDSDGTYAFSGLTAGVWILREVVPADHIQTFPYEPDDAHRVTLTAGQAVTELDFGNQPVNLSPVIDPIPDVFAIAGELVLIPLSVTDPEGDDSTKQVWVDGVDMTSVINGVIPFTPGEEHVGRMLDAIVVATQDDDPTLTTTETFKIFVGGVPAEPDGVPKVDPSLVPPGGEIKVSGGGFASGSSGGTFLFSEPVVLGTAEVGEDGSFTTTFALPMAIELGSHQVVVMGIDGSGDLRVLVTEIEVVAEGIDASSLIAFLDELPSDVFKRFGHRTAMKATISAASFAVNLGQGERALDILSSLDRRIDGCGTRPDRNDWIVDCEAQIEFRELFDLYKRGIETLPVPGPFPWW